MYKNLKISLVMPARNEARSLKAVLARIPDCVDEIIVVSNRSTDNTAKLAGSLGAKVIEDNRVDAEGIGYGYSHMSGIAAASGDIIVGADCDGSYPVEVIPAALEFLLKNDLNFLSCNRYPVQPEVEIHLLLRLGVNILNLETSFLYGRRVKDILSGMWIFRRSIAGQLNLNEGGWNLSPQIKISAMTTPQVRFGEFQIGQHRRIGKTHQSYLKTGVQHMLWILKNRLRMAVRWKTLPMQEILSEEIVDNA